MYFLCEETDNTSFRIIKKYFESMLRRVQFTFSEGAIVISCVDQKLSTLQEMMDSLTKFMFLAKSLGNFCQNVHMNSSTRKPDISG